MLHRVTNLIPVRRYVQKFLAYVILVIRYCHLVCSFKNEFNFWNVHGIMNTSDLVQSK